MATATKEQRILRVQDKMARYAISTRRLAKEVGTSHTTVYRFLRGSQFDLPIDEDRLLTRLESGMQRIERAIRELKKNAGLQEETHV